MEDGEVVELPDYAADPEALLLQSFTRVAVAVKAVGDAKRVYERSAASALLWEANQKKQAALTSGGASKLSAAVALFTARADAFNAAKRKQLATT